MLSTPTKKQIKDKLIGMKLTSSLVEAIDKDAESEGLSRSAIIRRVLIEHYRDSEKDF